MIEILIVYRPDRALRISMPRKGAMDAITYVAEHKVQLQMPGINRYPNRSLTG